MAVEIRVIYGDTDQMGVVYYGNYLRYFEAARAEFFRARGGSYLEFEKAGYKLPVVEALARYRKSALYDDLLLVKTSVDYIKGASLKFVYEVFRDGELLADGHTVHACINAEGKPVRFPDDARRLLSAGSGP